MRQNNTKDDCPCQKLLKPTEKLSKSIGQGVRCMLEKHCKHANHHSLADSGMIFTRGSFHLHCMSFAIVFPLSLSGSFYHCALPPSLQAPKTWDLKMLFG